MTVGTAFQPIVSSFQVEQAVVATLKEWFATYLAEVQRQHALDTLGLPAPKSYEVYEEFDVRPGQILPAVVVTSPGTTGSPEVDGEGKYYVGWRTGVTVVVTARNRTETRRNQRLYAAAARAILVQRPSLGGVTAHAVWNGEAHDDGPQEKNRTFGASTLDMTFYTEDTVTRLAGPLVPDPESPDFPIAQEVFLDIEAEGG